MSDRMILALNRHRFAPPPPKQFIKTDPRGVEYGYYSAYLPPPHASDHVCTVTKYDAKDERQYAMRFMSEVYFDAWAKDCT